MADQRKLITAIIKQNKRGKRYDIYIDGVFAFDVHEDVLVKHRLAKGQRVSADEMASIMADDELQKAYGAALRYLGHRPRTVREVKRKLKRQQFAEDCIARVIDRLIKERYLNDSELAAQLAEERIRLHKRGARWVAFELKEKGVDETVIDQAIRQLDPDQEFKAALKLARARWERGLKREEPCALKRKIAASLARRGYDSDIVRKVLRALDADDWEEDTFA